jgi:hypothetical protein
MQSRNCGYTTHRLADPAHHLEMCAHRPGLGVRHGVVSRKRKSLPQTASKPASTARFAADGLCTAVNPTPVRRLVAAATQYTNRQAQLSAEEEAHVE